MARRARRGGSRLDERLGAALVAPAAAMAEAETPEEGGRAPADLAVLVLAGFTATHLLHLARAGWLAVDGDVMGAIHILLTQLSGALRAPLLFVLVGGTVVTAAAGSRRSVAADFDLACIAAVPIGAIAALVELAARAGLAPWSVRHGALVASCAWSAALLLPAIRQARRRAPRPSSAPSGSS